MFVCVCAPALSPKVSLENTEAINFMATFKKGREERERELREILREFAVAV